MTFIHEAGWPIWLVLAPGALSLALAASHALKPRREMLPLIVGFGVLTLVAGALGATLGVQCSIEHIQEMPASERWIVLIGLRESLQNAVAALLLVGASAVTTMIGSYRGSRRSRLDGALAARPTT